MSEHFDATTSAGILRGKVKDLDRFAEAVDAPQEFRDRLQELLRIANEMLANAVSSELQAGRQSQ